MAQIVLAPLEKNDLLRVLDYAMQKKTEELEKDKVNTRVLKDDIQKIKILKSRVMGNDYKPNYHARSTSYNSGGN